MVNIPTAAAFLENYKLAVKAREVEEAKRQDFTQEQTIAYQRESVEKAFIGRNPTVDEVTMPVEEPFHKSIIKELTDRGYNVEYKKVNNSYVAVIYPRPVMPSLSGSLFGPLAMLMASELFSAKDMLTLLMDAVNVAEADVSDDETPVAPAPTPAANKPSCKSCGKVHAVLY